MQHAPSSVNLDLLHGIPVKIEAPCWISPPRGWDTVNNCVESIFVVRRPSDLPSHAVIVVEPDSSGDTDVVTPSWDGSRGWKTAMDPNDWDNVGYGTFYWDALAAADIIHHVFRHHSILPPGTELRRSGDRVLQLFLTGIKPSGSLTHRDDTSSILYVVSGSKVVWLAPPGVETVMKIIVDESRFINYDPDGDAQRNRLIWKKVILSAGDSLFLPKGWWHYVRSTAGTVALSLVLSPSRTVSEKVKLPEKIMGDEGRSGRPLKRAKRSPPRTIQQASRDCASLKSGGSSSSSSSSSSSTCSSKIEVVVVVEEEEEEEEEDVSMSSWTRLLWVHFDVCKICQRWPAAVLKSGAVVYIGSGGGEVTHFSVMDTFVGDSEDIRKQTGGHKSAKLNHAIQMAQRWQDTTKQKQLIE